MKEMEFKIKTEIVRAYKGNRNMFGINKWQVEKISTLTFMEVHVMSSYKQQTSQWKTRIDVRCVLFANLTSLSFKFESLNEGIVISNDFNDSKAEKTAGAK